MKVLVTGASGFIGSHLHVALKARGHEVWLRDKRWGGSTARVGTPQDIAGLGADVIVHLGAQCSTARSLDDPVRDFIDNALGTVNVCEAARLAGGTPILFASTVKVGAGRDGKLTPLGASKRVGEQYLALFRDLYAVPSVVLRPSTVYGPGQDGTAEAGWVTWFVRAALSGRAIEVAGDGQQSRDVLYIDDMTALLVDIVEHFADYEQAAGRWPYEVGGGPDNEVSLRSLLAELGYHNMVPGDCLVGELGRVVSNNRRISAVHGWKPTVGWREGLARTVAWVKGQLGG